MKFLSSVLSWMFLVIPNVFAFQVTPSIEATGQALKFTCSQEQIEPCHSLCQKQECLIPETACRSCSGTHELYMKRILDGVGTTIKATVSVPVSGIYPFLTAGSFISLHAQTLYNYSSVYNGALVQAQFRSLCPRLSPTAITGGILLIQANSLGTPSGIIGALCPDEANEEWSFFQTNSRFQKR